MNQLCKILDDKFAPFKFTMEQHTLSANYKKNMPAKKIKDLQGKIYDSSNVDKADAEKYKELKRDCTDMAVKIGFELNARQLDALTNTTDECIKSSIENIANIFLPKAIGLLSPLQSSDPIFRKDTKELLDKQKTLLVILLCL